MRNQSHNKTRIATLLEYVDKWRHAMDWSRETVCTQIVEAHYRIGADRLTQVKFEQGGDAFTIQKNNADRIYRWLDDKTKDKNLLCANFEQSILAAMPADIRMACLNELLAPLGLVVRGVDVQKPGTLNATMHLVKVARESSEAQGAMAELIDGATPAELAKADRELAEAEEAIRVARAAVRSQIEAA